MAELLSYGIQTDQSDYRIHVCVVVKRFFIYRTAIVREMSLNKYREVDGRQQNIVTARGYLVPPRDIPQVSMAAIPLAYFDEFPITESMSTREKGRAAECMVTKALQDGVIKLPAQVRALSDTQSQYAGHDLIIDSVRIQVKCDFRGGPRTYGGSGSLFIQTAESNPFKQY